MSRSSDHPPSEHEENASRGQSRSSDTPASVEDLVAAARAGTRSRRAFIAGLAALGVSGVGAAAVYVGVTRPSQPRVPTPQQQHLQQHDQHVQDRNQGNVPGLTADYAHDAVVEDPLFAQPFVGAAAIAARHAAEAASVPDRALRILNRGFAGDQLIVEWEASGTHAAAFLGFGGTGRPFRIRGLTVVTRRDGKIVRESHYYDTAELRRQVEG